MNSLYRSTLHTIDDCKSSLNGFGARLLKSRQRNFSNTRLMQYNPQEQIKLSQECPIQSQKQLFNHSGDIKKYCFNRFKSSDKFQGLRKNSSLKAIVKNQSQRSNLTKPELLIKESLPEEVEVTTKCDKVMTISIKRRVELIKKNQNRLKLNAATKETIVLKDAPRSDVSLGQGLKAADQPDKISSNQKIWSQNYLGEGLKKSSSSKMKILVKNPFEKLMRQQESKLTQATPRPQSKECNREEEIDFKESQILSKLESSYTSFAYRCELEQMLAMM